MRIFWVEILAIFLCVGGGCGRGVCEVRVRGVRKRYLGLDGGYELGAGGGGCGFG